MDTEKRDQSSWNIASLQAYLIYSLLQDAKNAYISGDIKKWYVSLTAIRENINQELTQLEREGLDDTEAIAGKLNMYYEKYSNFLESADEKSIKDIQDKYKIIRRRYSMIVRKYSRKVMDLLKASGYLPSKEERTKLSF